MLLLFSVVFLKNVVTAPTRNITGFSSSLSMGLLVLWTHVLVHRCLNLTYEFLTWPGDSMKTDTETNNSRIEEIKQRPDTKKTYFIARAFFQPITLNLGSLSLRRPLQILLKEPRAVWGHIQGQISSFHPAAVQIHTREKPQFVGRQSCEHLWVIKFGTYTLGGG